MSPEKQKLLRKKQLHKEYVKAAPFSGLSFFKKTHAARWIIISCHYPWAICWSWFVDIQFHWPKASRYHWKSFIHRDGRGKISCIGLRFGFGGIYYHSQDADYHMKDEYFKQGTVQ